jgi:hypothetical protein
MAVVDAVNPAGVQIQKIEKLLENPFKPGV